MKFSIRDLILAISVLFWIAAQSTAQAEAAGQDSKRKKKDSEHPSVEQLQQSGRLGEPFAVLATPERQVQVFRLTSHDGAAEWTYMVVSVDADGSRHAYGDHKTVDVVLDELTQGFRATSARGPRRCPAASGWRFERAGLKHSLCSESVDTQRIERAVGLLDTSPRAN